MSSMLELDHVFSQKDAQRQLLLLDIILKQDLEDGRYRQILRSIIDSPSLVGIHAAKILAYIALQDESVRVGDALNILRSEGHLR